MQGSEHFKHVIQRYLDNRASSDQLFSVAYANPSKSIDQCVNFILDFVQKSGCNGFSSDEIHSIAVDYYDELNGEFYQPIHCRVVINEPVELSAEEIAEARREAYRRAENEAHALLTRKKRPQQRQQSEVENQLSLF